MLKKTLILAAGATLAATCGLSSAETVITTTTTAPTTLQMPHTDTQKEVIHGPTGERTVIKKKVHTNVFGETSVKKKVISQRAGEPDVVSRRVELLPVPATSTTVIERVD
jgi:hypothetical protein